MPLPTDARIVDARFAVEDTPFRAPLKFGGRVVDRSSVINVHVTLELRDGSRRAEGFGSMPVGNVWAWPGAVEPDLTGAAMKRFAESAAADAVRLGATGHPLELGTALEHRHRALADAVTAGMGIPAMPDLAVLVAASPTDAAVHDAFGKLHGVNSYDALGAAWCAPDLASFLTPEFAGRHLDRYTLRTPKPRMPLYHLVGALDPVSPGEMVKPIGDGLPETLEDWIRADGLTHLKIKLSGDDAAWDLARVAAVDDVAGRFDRPWRYSLDFNEKCPSAGSLVDWLSRLKARRPAAFARVQYLEQPTARDLRAHPDNRMHRAAEIKPVVIDESLTSLEMLLLAREQGYSGIALKACKGHTHALLMGAYAQHHGLFLCVQDLTCPGASFLHSAGIAARLPTVAAIEGNGRQYCPAGNRGWSDRHPGAFRVREGTVDTSTLTGPGLGH